MDEPQDTPSPQRQFDEKEISALLKRAAEFQAFDAEQPAFGLTLKELQVIAAEVGIAPAHVAMAVQEMEDATDREKMDLWGGPFSLVLERSVPGEIEDAIWEKMISATRSVYGEAGQVKLRGLVKEWIYDGSGMQARVSLLPEEGQTTIQLSWREQVLPVPFYTFSSAISLIMLPVIFEAWGLVSPTGVFLYLGVVSALFFLARFAVSRVLRRKKDDAKKLMRQLESLVRTDGGVKGIAVKRRAENDAVAGTKPFAPDAEEQTILEHAHEDAVSSDPQDQGKTLKNRQKANG